MARVSMMPGGWPLETADLQFGDGFPTSGSNTAKRTKHLHSTTPYPTSAELHFGDSFPTAGPSTAKRTKHLHSSTPYPVSAAEMHGRPNHTSDQASLIINHSNFSGSTASSSKSTPLSPKRDPPQPPSTPDELFLPSNNIKRVKRSTTPVIPKELCISRVDRSLNTSPIQSLHEVFQTKDVDELYVQVPTNPQSHGLNAPSQEDSVMNENTFQPTGPCDVAGDKTVPTLSLTAPYPDSSSQSFDWTTYDPPQELLHTDPNASSEIEVILPLSIHKIREKHAEEELWMFASQADETLKILSRRPHTVRKPELISVSGNMDPLQKEATEEDRNEASTAGSSSLMLSPADSGYGSSTGFSSMSPENSASSSRKSLSKFSALFKRKHKSKEMIATTESAAFDISNASSVLAAITEPIETANVIVRVDTASPQVISECVSCLEDFTQGDLVKLVCHSYCKECFQALIKNALESETQWPAKCCLNPIPSVKILANIDRPSQLKYKQREAEWAIPAGDRIYCSRRSCGVWVRPRSTNKQPNCAKCRTCGHKTCTLCRSDFHNGNDCPQDTSVQATLDLAEQEGWKRCYRCSALVEHNQGCRHMTCRCKAEFCYICSARWRTCTCADGDIIAVQHRAEQRRRDQEAQNELAASLAAARVEEERQILLEVEAFIRAEEVREAREAELLRILAEQQRKRREEERVRTIHERFQALNAELKVVHETQKSLIIERHEHHTLVLQTEHEDRLNVLSLKHAADRSSSSEEVQKTIAKTQEQFVLDFSNRKAAEIRVEEQYSAELAAYWNGKPDADLKISSRLDELRSDQQKQYMNWDLHRKNILQSIEDKENEKLSNLQKVHNKEVEDADSKAKIDGSEWEQKKWCEMMWFNAALTERRAMLENLQVEEYAKEE